MIFEDIAKKSDDLWDLAARPVFYPRAIIHLKNAFGLIPIDDLFFENVQSLHDKANEELSVNLIVGKRDEVCDCTGPLLDRLTLRILINVV